MIDRNDFDQRIAAHLSTVTRVNETGWQRQGQGQSQAIRAALATALVALAARLAPERTAAATLGQARRELPATT